MENTKQVILGLCKSSIQREGITELTAWLEASDFFSAPASTRYHGSHVGGLAEHSLNVYRCLKEELAASNEYRDTYSEETIAIAALFHDICKVNLYKPGTRNVKNEETGQWEKVPTYTIDEKFPCGHGEKSVIILQSFMRLYADEILAIRAHMGGFDASVKAGEYFVGKIFETCPLALLLHIADMKATYLLEG